MTAVGQIAKRLKSELMDLMMDTKLLGVVSAFPLDDDITHWVGTINGQSDTHYEGMEFKIDMTFPATYPMTPPVVKFVTPIFHPNIDMSGNICLDTLKEQWVPTTTVTTLLISVMSLLETPNNASPLNNQAAELWDNNKAEFLRLAKRRYHNLTLS